MRCNFFVLIAAILVAINAQPIGAKKVIIVTGVSRGIGRAIVDVLFENPDVAVYGIARTEQALKEIKMKYGERFEYVAGSVTIEQNLQELVNRALLKYGRIDGVIANAGLTHLETVGEESISNWQSIFDTNLFSVVNLIKLTLPSVQKTGGTYVLVSSEASVVSTRFLSAYSASKAGLNSLAASIAFGYKEVKAIAVGPGAANTTMWTTSIADLTTRHPAEGRELSERIKTPGYLKPAELPARSLANIAVRGIDANINGKYYEYDNPILSKYTK